MNGNPSGRGAKTETAVASFDVFDTVLTRAVGSPEAVFLLLGRRLARRSLIAGPAEAFARARVEAEGRAYRRVGDWCTLEAIYAELAAVLGLADAECRQVTDQEYQLEDLLTREVPGARDRIQRARSHGQRIVYVSDTYLPSEFVQQLLTRHGLFQRGDGCYVSSASGNPKRSGALFAELVRREDLAAERVTHQGNSVDLDLRPAARIGLRAIPFLQGNLNRFEQLLEHHAGPTEGLASAMAGAARLARLALPAHDERQAALRDVAVGVAAPVLVGYVLWVLHRAQQLGLERLYFLSRDGQVLLDVARRLAQTLDLPMGLRYLYASRQAWNLPAIATGSDEELAWIWDTTDHLSVRSLFARVALEPESAEEDLRSAGLPPAEWSRSLTWDERRALRPLLANPRTRGMILRRAQEKRSLLLAYLGREGVLEPKPWGLVDLGWHGSMQNALTSLVVNAGGKEPIGFYFALLKGAIADQCADRREAYYFDERLGQGCLDAVPNLIPLMEMFCAADHGTVVDFAELGGEVEPVLRQRVSREVVDWGLPFVREAIRRFAANLLLDADMVNPWADVRRAITDVLNAFWWNPTRREAEAWATFPWEDGLGQQTYANPVAQRYEWRDVVAAMRAGRVLPHHRASWSAGSLALSTPGVRIPLRALTYARWRFPFLRAWLDRAGRPSTGS